MLERRTNFVYSIGIRVDATLYSVVSVFYHITQYVDCDRMNSESRKSIGCLSREARGNWTQVLSKPSARLDVDLVICAATTSRYQSDLITSATPA